MRCIGCGETGLRQALHQSPGTSPRTKMTVSPATSEKNSSSRTSSQGSMEGLTEEKGDAEKITAATGVVRRRPSFERAKKVPSPSEQPSSVKASLPEMNRTYNSKRTESEPPPPPPPTPCTENEPDLKEPSAPLGNHASPTKGSLSQPSPTHGRIPTPNRRGIPVRSSPAQRTGIPRPRSSAYPKSQLPMPGSKSSIPSRRTSPQVRDEDWKDGCY
ncbi:putative SLAIN motif-containing protein 2 isoform X3 [Apostichopus japonicus]|uniref:Putative SLAIN motif-containing protein 2 isoform X3 n=1 Tax=Stichopus japonicus TaxID=307972 RepID=A0A2G8K8R8_STIJA|nr:putative SLAIN motif-containing protein 2 isoform X3 [Apostichopus japonicus]